MKKENLELLAAVYGCLPDEFVLRTCRHCGEKYELETGGKELICPDCDEEFHVLEKLKKLGA